MAEILSQRSLVLAKIEVTFGVDPIPVASTDALLVSDPDFSVDITEIERNFARQSLSPLPIAAGRKIASMTFVHEVRSNGIFSGSTPPKVGVLLRACGYAQTSIVVNGTAVNGRVDVTADSGNTGPATTWAAQGTNVVIKDCPYNVRVTVLGVSATAEMRVTGGCAPQDQLTDSTQEKNAILTETFQAEKVSGTLTGTMTIDDATDPKSVTYDTTNLLTIGIGDVIRVTVMGIPFLVTTTGTTVGQTATDIAAIINAHADFAASAVTNVVTVTFSGNAASVVVTSASTALTLGASGHAIVPTWTGSQDLNDKFVAVAKPTGHEYAPISTGFESITVYMFFDGLLHKMTASRGTFTIEGAVGGVANFNFEFTGNFVTVTDVALPTATFETTIPVQVELAELQVNQDVDKTVATTGILASDSWDDSINGVQTGLCASSFSFDQANEVSIRDCINDADSFKGVVITNRAPVGTIDPEVELVATHDFWNLLATADVLSWQVRVGTVRGNVVRLESDSVQYRGLSYADRNGLRVLEVDLSLSGTSPSFADDEILVAFN